MRWRLENLLSTIKAAILNAETTSPTDPEIIDWLAKLKKQLKRQVSITTKEKKRKREDTHSYVPAPDVTGRSEEKEYIIKLLKMPRPRGHPGSRRKASLLGNFQTS
uniref:Uncharacterized protein n=1 Tax=Nelumbo nucifera TaxID=4432 RepID=A0A822Y0A1_NELNU|nr:TPA_asm: hypothetical protein HUJ06_027188 [Nelumbo nucifera]